MNRDVVEALVWAGAIIVLALGATFAQGQGVIDDETTSRIVVGAIGLSIVWQGNRIPKAVAPSAYARQATRFAGWALVLSGLIYAGTWIFAPIPVAVVVGCGAVAVAAVATVGYCVWLRGKAVAAV